MRKFYMAMVALLATSMAFFTGGHDRLDWR